MLYSPQSQSVIDELLAGRNVSYGGTNLGPLDQRTSVLLSLMFEQYDQLDELSGDQRAKFLREAYAKKLAALEENDLEVPLDPTSQESPAQDEGGTATSGYRLKAVECTSFRGIAPVGETVRFSFECASNLIYGPNGSGKSSLLGAVIWTISGHAVSDAHESSSTVPIHRPPSSGGTRRKIADWSVVATLPDGQISEQTIQECAASVELETLDGSSQLHVRRSLGEGLEVKLGESDWKACADLAEFGIQPLDIQLSLHAPNTFGRFTVENAPDTKSLLSLMLGFDGLEDLGDLSTTLSGNRTRLANKELADINAAKKALSERLSVLPTRLPATQSFRKTLEDLSEMPQLTKAAIAEAGKSLGEEIRAAESDLLNLLGLTDENIPTDFDLADQLTAAVVNLERGVKEIFPTLGQLKIAEVFAAEVSEASAKPVAEQIEKFARFLEVAQTQILERFELWKKETAPASKTTLLLKTAEYFDPSNQLCPVCDRSLSGIEVKEELIKLGRLAPELRFELKTYFQNLIAELEQCVPSEVRAVATRSPGERIANDWKKLSTITLPSEFRPLINKFNQPILDLVSGISLNIVDTSCLMPAAADLGFVEAATRFFEVAETAANAIAVMTWSRDELAKTEQNLSDLVAGIDPQTEASLLGCLATGKDTAAAIAPLKALLSELQWVYEQHVAISEAEAQHAILEELKAPLDTIKLLKKYAEFEVKSVFSKIRESTISNWQTMYPKQSTGLAPARLIMGAGRDRSVTALLSKGEFEVPEQFFGNAGLQRAVALSFYFALLDMHPGCLQFVILDDPILSLDDSHRERWSREILKPCMPRFQFVVATHQKHYLTSCRHDFVDGKVHQLNDRPWPRRISWQPADGLKRAEQEMAVSADNTPNIMRIHCEDMLSTLETYANSPFVVRTSLRNSVDAYAALPATDPLAAPRGRRDIIVSKLKDNRVQSVLNPGSHHETQADVTISMCQDCLNVLKECDKAFRLELARLEKEYQHSRRQAEIPSSVISFSSGPSCSSWQSPITIRHFGRAAAKGEALVVESAEIESAVSLSPGSAVLVTSETLDPVAKNGQWVLLAKADTPCNDGDLVAVRCSDGSYLLRRIWSKESNWTFQAINPVTPVASFVAPKTDSAARKVIGVIYEPNREASSSTGTGIVEWQPRGDFSVEEFSKFASISIEGKSMEPIARSGQHVLINTTEASDYLAVRNGSLAVVETNTEEIGCVVKRIYRHPAGCMLLSPNPVDAHKPEFLTEVQLSAAKFWTVRGVLFDAQLD